MKDKKDFIFNSHGTLCLKAMVLLYRILFLSYVLGICVFNHIWTGAVPAEYRRGMRYLVTELTRDGKQPWFLEI